MAIHYPGKQGDGGYIFVGENNPGIYNPGDTIVLKASDGPRTYFYMSGIHGTADQPIIITNDSSGQVIVSFDLEHCTYIQVLGTGSADNYGFASTGCSLHGRIAHIEVSNIDINGGAFGFWIKNEASCDSTLQYPNWYIDYIHVHHCRVRNITYEGMYCGSTDPNALWLDRNPIVCNGVPATSGQYKPTRLGHFHIHHNIFDKTGRAAIQLSDAELGISEIHHNYITNSGLELSDGQGNGINIGLYSKVYIHNNYVDYVYTWGIASLGATYVRIENNIIDHTGYIPASAARDGISHELAWAWGIIVTPRQTIPTQNTTFIIKNNKIGVRGSAQTYDIEVDDNYGNYPNFNTDNIIAGNTRIYSAQPAVISISGASITYSTGPYKLKTVGTGEYVLAIIGDDGTLYAQCTNSNLTGTNGAPALGKPTACVQEFGTMPKFIKAFGGLHDAMAIDISGSVWHLGDNGNGEAGIGDTIAHLYTTKISTDNLGNSFTGIVDMASFVTASDGGWVAVKNDGTVWIWGKCTGGFLGNGTVGSSQLRPVQVTIPGGRSAVQVVAGYQIIIRCSDGTVWSWGGGGCDDYQHSSGYGCNGTSWQTPTQVSNVTGATGIAGGRNWNWAWNATTVWYWGMREYAGIGATGTPWGVAQDITTSITNYIQLPIKSITTNSSMTHIIDNTGAIFGAGSSPQGELGNGTASDMVAQNWSWNFQWLSVPTLTRIIPERNDFINIYGASPYTYFSIFEANDGQLYFTGRNKGLGINGEISGDYIYGGIEASFPNSWDQDTAIAISPFLITEKVLKPSPYCILHPTTGACVNYSIPSSNPPIPNAGADKIISNDTTLISGSALAASGRVISVYRWEQVSGPSYPYVSGINTPALQVNNLVKGTYQFRLWVEDNLGETNTDTVNLFVYTGSAATRNGKKSWLIF